MRIVDAQIHPPSPEPSVEVAMASMDAVGVSAAVVVDELARVLEFVHRDPDRFAGVPYAWFADVPWRQTPPVDLSADERLAQLAATPGILGIRMLIGIRDGARVAVLREGGYDRYLAAAERLRLPVCVTMHGYMPDLHDTVRAHPELTFVIDHVGLYTPPFAPEGVALFDDLPAVLAFARYPNVAVKFTGVPSLSQQPYPFADVWPHMHKLLDAFGVDRLMWGSDFTRCRPLHSYREAVDFLLHTGELSASDKEMLFSGSISRWLGWPARHPPVRSRRHRPAAP